MTLSDRLRSEGYAVDFAADGDEGLSKATTLPFDLIILDIMLPNRSGLDVCRDVIHRPVLVSESEIAAAMRLGLETEHWLIEGAAAVASLSIVRYLRTTFSPNGVSAAPPPCEPPGWAVTTGSRKQRFMSSTRSQARR